MHADQLRYAAKAAGYNAKNAATSYAPKKGDEIFEGTDYPRAWTEFVGQTKAMSQLRAACYTAQVCGAPLGHVLLASGLHGIGKTSMAKIIAADMGVGIVEVSGKISLAEIRPVLKQMEDGDVLFIDEIHQLVSGGKSKAEWLLHLLQDGVLMTSKGAEQVPQITVVAATTDVQQLPETIISRFRYKPELIGYTVDEAVVIAEGMARKVGFDNVLLPAPSKETLRAISLAANCGPRDIKGLLYQLKDAAICRYSTPDEAGTYDLTTTLDWAGLSYDGLNTLAQDYLCVMLTAQSESDFVALKTITSKLGEPGPVHHTEQLLLQKNYITINPRGRRLTSEGVQRTVALLSERGLLDDTEEAA